jgi:hypothetical protein
VFSISFNVSDEHRIPAHANATAAFTFIANAPISAGGFITLNYPSAFFAPGITPSSAICNVEGLSLALYPASSTSIKFGTANADIARFAQVSVTVYGLTMGAATLGSHSGITIQTSSDIAVSVAVASGGIFGRATQVALQISLEHRIAGNSNCTATLSFTPSADIPVGGAITFSYPFLFFAADVTPTAAVGSVDAAVFVSSPSTNTSLVLTLFSSPSAITGATPFVVTIYGMTMGAATEGSPVGITVKSSSDTALSHPVPSGPIFISLVPVASSASPTSPFAGDMITVSGHSFLLPGIEFNCSARIGPRPSEGVAAMCSAMSSSEALVQVPHDILATPSFVELTFNPGNFTSIAATRLCPCLRAVGGVVCGCSSSACTVPMT